MKTICILLSFIAVISIGCKKEDTIKSENKLTTIKPENPPVIVYRSFQCCDEDGNWAVQCCAATISNCTAGLPCTTILWPDGLPRPCPNIVSQLLAVQEWGFTSDELQDFDIGKDIFKTDDTYIQNHYAFFEYLYQLGITYHPDEIMEYNN